MTDLCVCGHPQHHHGLGQGCGTVTVWGPPSTDDASAHLEHPGRNWGACHCDEYEAAT